ncbi:MULTISPECIES: carbamoyl-phosphate synthase large subunit [Prochlorococcus]|uniref:Carbamoyl phosphate synthase large chain n=1 Tax=Prochlorococcus marinus str. MIT 9116 TaxID=167544 RepID=A0A0A1ZQG7_PROMR|nr:carbamoyl-phosphate synthase large subunit [Prochlorococcus marinus]KGF89506.1 Carbamoyl-phosphate synthase large chain [Prochlorococcus marinus str. MIT 9107]KGF90484.1 Carbamoyl-phosphate synthase large chain [Prochlorococcus marinus str. MIT 9116]KGF92963.1 Carbamoyl-phosphate synthase large chain [Prochlorococcus marinus str. MIT 9123]
MPQRGDLKKILILGSGPIVIGQACEFDYSGTQACKALRKAGYEIILINSNPASIMTDPEIASKTYIEPLTPEIVSQIILREKPDAVLPTMGGQTALNLAVKLSESDFLKKNNVELIGADLKAINKAEDRKLFKESMEKINVNVCPSGIASNLTEAKEVSKKINSYPLIIRPAFTLGGVGGGIAFNLEEFIELCKTGLEESPSNQILIEKSLIGWKEFELEVMRDTSDNVVIVCSIENLDPMGVHTGDSITVAPAQTLTDKEYQRLRDLSLKIIREVGVETGGSNIQFAINPTNGDVIVIEMNPRVSRSSALASKATGFPIAKIAALLSVGYTLDEIINDITKKTPACFEPSIDYVVTKIPRFAFEKFKGTSKILSTAMKSVGESMAIGRSFEESFQKALRSLEVGISGWEFDSLEEYKNENDLKNSLRNPTSERILIIKKAMQLGKSNSYIQEVTNIDLWFIEKLRNIFNFEIDFLKEKELYSLDRDLMLHAKQLGFSDQQIAKLTNSDFFKVREYRKDLNINPIYKTVDTCSAEFSSSTPYHYSTYEESFINLNSQIFDSEISNNNESKKIMILGGGPNRIGQGIEFDYCCCHASYQASANGYKTIMVNSNPETVSTDYDTSDILYFEPVTLEDVLNIIEAENPHGLIVQFGGQTPLKISLPLFEWLKSNDGVKTGSKILGTSPISIDLAEDREEFTKILEELNIRQPLNGIARNQKEAQTVAKNIGFPLVVRPSYVLGGRAMEIVKNENELSRYISEAVKVSPDHPILLDQYLNNAIEIDVDALCDSEGSVVIAGLMEHVEPAGIHSGDSACCLPSISLSKSTIDTVKSWTKLIAKRLEVIGLINLQFAVTNINNKENKLFILEANPRASRTVPFVSKAIGKPIAKLATQLMQGLTLEDVNFTKEFYPKYQAVKEAVLPFKRFPGSDTLLGPEMRSTGEVMGLAKDFGIAYAKSELASGNGVPSEGVAFLSTNDLDKKNLEEIARELLILGFKLIATKGTASYLVDLGIQVDEVLKVHEGRPNIEDLIRSGLVQLVINTPIGSQALHDDAYLRRAALEYNIPTFTTIPGAKAAIKAIKALQSNQIYTYSLQEIHNY